MSFEPMPPSIIVTVDTEEEGLWNGRFRTSGNTVANVRGAQRFQQLCDRFQIRPTYLVDSPVVEDDGSVELLSGFQDAGRAEIGAHLHPWCAPPLVETTSVRNSYMCNLPEELQREKLIGLTEAIEDRFGRRPTSFRAGRYGLDIVGARILEELGYVVDSSVIPFTDYSSQGGPNFQEAPCTPYRVGKEDLCHADPEGQLLEVPVSVGYNWANFARARRAQELAGSRLLRPLRLVGILDRLGLVRRIKFSPEQADASRMTTLVEAYLEAGAPVMVMMLHSSSLVVGHSPYVPDERRLEAMYADLAATFEYCLGRRGMASHTLTSFAESYSAQVR